MITDYIFVSLSILKGHDYHFPIACMNIFMRIYELNPIEISFDSRKKPAFILVRKIQKANLKFQKNTFFYTKLHHYVRFRSLIERFTAHFRSRSDNLPAARLSGRPQTRL